ncbi:ethylbenzene dehydrogenase-related protein [Motilimonas pumila]|uniref:Cytochrome c-552/DMSO reductase-like haem-binding domain-containing protein n=1 Tax=Motilimonas pumila TaxID=2303987 RepID=A0A418YGU5_9GAMM|nr:ethylbenzene dehydrogenase-related protein [Motilimonas pumila]RJG48733.1 hypothetical protein D1Z90_07695 [Motilimonas pumila]
MKKIRTSHVYIVVTHLLAIIAFFTSLLSGFRLAQDSDFAIALPALFMPQGDVYFWHGLSALCWLLVVILYLGFHFLRPQPLRISPKRHRVIHLLYLLLALSFCSGVLLYLALPNLPYLFVQFCHYWLALLLIVVVIWHLIQHLQLPISQWLKVFIPGRQPSNQRRYLVLSAAAVVAITVSYAVSIFYPKLSPKLVSKPKHVAIALDGEATEWQHITGTDLLVAQGAKGAIKTVISAKAMHDESVIYFLFQWQDSSENLTHLPLIKTAAGWQVQHNGFGQDDEIGNYEDKFALMISDNARFGAAGSIHLGSQPLDNAPPSRSGRGYHYMQQGMADMWQWKASRLGHMAVLDDDHFGQPAPVCQHCPRYTAGYQADPKDSGGYRMNWQWFSESTVVPLRLPTADAWQRLAQRKRFAISWWDTEPYSEHLDNYPVGTQLPSVLWLDSFDGDRGDVRAKAQWHKGTWTLEIARDRDTYSEFDMALTSGVYLWPATFDASQTQHSYPQRPWQLVIQEGS